MRIGIVQFAPKLREVERNLRLAERLIRANDADLFVLPELFATGYFFKDKDEIRPFAEKFQKSKTLTFLADIAYEKDCAIIGCFPELSGEKIFNSSAFIYPRGKKVLYRKVHLFNNEKLIFEPGNLPFPLVEYRDTKIAFIICFDWFFPEVYRSLALKGAQLVCHSANLVLPHCQKASYAHAVSNRIFIALSNRTGSDVNGGGKVDFTGKSIMYGPDGSVLGELGMDEEGVLVIEIDPSKALDKMVTPFNDVILDRRPEFYEGL
ncbi:beta-ureidopropionase [bacterium]|nr:beta-ureidopropionase [bacterium]